MFGLNWSLRSLKKITSLRMTRPAVDTAFVRDLYLALLRREPDHEGFHAYCDALGSGLLSRRSAIESFLNSDEFRRLHFPTSAPRHLRDGFLRSEVEALCKNFQKYTGKGKRGYATNFLGGLTCATVTYDAMASQFNGRVEEYPVYGNLHGDGLEWIGVLRAVVEARENFTMLELGAGWAPWCAVGYCAARQRGIKEINLIAVEGDAGHVQFARENFSINEIAESSGHIFHGAVGLADGKAMFPQARDASTAYGGIALWSDDEQPANANLDLSVYTRLAEVPCYSLETLTHPYDIIDLIHCDIQGGEAPLFTAAIDLVCKKVKRVVVGTHSLAIDRNLVNLFGKSGWELEGMHACAMQEEDGETLLLEDGTQVWRNPRIS